MELNKKFWKAARKLVESSGDKFNYAIEPSEVEDFSILPAFVNNKLHIFKLSIIEDEGFYDSISYTNAVRRELEKYSAALLSKIDDYFGPIIFCDMQFIIKGEHRAFVRVHRNIQGGE
jgi:hypothetical protein